MKAYTQYNDRGLSKIIKATRKEYGFKDDYKSYIVNILPKALSLRGVDKEDIWFHSRVFLAHRYFNSTHLFLENGVHDFVINSLPDDYIKITSLYGCFKNLPIAEPNDKNNPRVVFVHFPLKEAQYSIAIIPDAVCPFDGERIGMFKWNFFATNGEDYILHLPNQKMGPRIAELAFLKLVCGLSLYTEAFPECIAPTSGAGTVKHFPRYKGNKNIIKAVDIAQQENHHSSSPHFRRGHFRFLSSERFTNAKGTVVFVKGCFVKGKAYDVLSLDNVQE